MKSLNKRQQEKVYLVTIIFLLTISFVWFYKATYYINPWPTDSYYFYRSAARRVFTHIYISEIHQHLTGSIFKVLLHGKEALILAIAIMQKALGDTKTIFPNIVVLLIANHISALLIYLIGRKLFDPLIGFIGFLLYATCFWPYLYVLQGAHPPMALMFLLLSVITLLYADRSKSLYVIAGTCFGFMLFSSPASPIYIPYYLFFWILLRQEYFHKPVKTLPQRLKTYLLFGAGALGIILYFTLPRPLESIGDYFKFVSCNQYANHFYILQEQVLPFLPKNHPILSQPDLIFRGAGLIWLVKYCFHIMPILFSFYILCIVYLLLRHFRNPYIILIILLSLSTPIAVELSGAAQFGRNYYSWFPGIIFLICFAIKKVTATFSKKKGLSPFLSFLGLFLLANITFNAYIFFSDIFPTRMAMTKVDLFLRKHGISDLFVHRLHPSHENTTAVLNNPHFKNKVHFWAVTDIAEVNHGYIFLPPIKGFHNCVNTDFDEDPYLTELYNSGELEKFVIAEFPTLAASKIWIHEEEICTYRELILGNITEEDRQKGTAYILDARKLHQE